MAKSLRQSKLDKSDGDPFEPVSLREEKFTGPLKALQVLCPIAEVICFTSGVLRTILFYVGISISCPQLNRECLAPARMLGAGQFGTVYMAVQTQSLDDTGGVQRAVKLLQAGASSEDKGEFIREAETMQRLVHPNIVSVSLEPCARFGPDPTFHGAYLC